MKGFKKIQQNKRKKKRLLSILYTNFQNNSYYINYQISLKYQIFLDFFNCLYFFTYKNHYLFSSFILRICKEKNKKPNAKWISINVNLHSYYLLHVALAACTIVKIICCTRHICRVNHIRARMIGGHRHANMHK